MADEFICRHFFDGKILYGTTRIVREDSVVTRLEPSSLSPDFYLIAPGLVDIQMNGFGANDVSAADKDTLRSLDAELALHGTTSWCGTILTAPLERMTNILQKLELIWQTNSIPGFVGVHVEGPFLGSVPGAHRSEWICEIDQLWLVSLPRSVRIVTMGTEQADIENAIVGLARRGISASLGHSQPSKEQFIAAVNAGAVLVTHLFNGMSGIHHRDVGLALLALNEPRVRVGLIADMVHVSPDAISLAFTVKGSAGICLVSDSIAWATPSAQKRGIGIDNGAPRLPDGTLAGSSTPLAECVSRCVHRANVPIDVALRAATSTPAEVLGIGDIGRITVGRSADFIALDDSLSVVNTWRRLPSTCA